MKCFNHHAHEAVGICKHCNKGICVDCLIDTGDGLACNTGCLSSVEGVNAIIKRQITMYGSNSNAMKQRTIFYLAFSIFFITMAFQVKQNLWLQIIFISMGGMFILMALSSWRQIKKL